MIGQVLSKQPSRYVLVSVALVALLFAVFTNHVWEDYYITFRSSKNLATGHGLVFNHGDRLHTFTSPLGVLLPAAASLLSGNASDAAALWIFRVMCAVALGGAAALLFGLGQRLRWPVIAAGLLAVLLATDAKILDFTINGMETAFMLLFLAYAIHAHLTPGPRQWVHLGGAWAGLMWTRPDSIIYIGLVAAGCWIFNDPARTGGDRRQQLGLFLKAGLLTTALYGPWLLWAWWYYGTPIPHTIVAKGAQSGGLDALARFKANFWRLPWLIWQGRTAAEATFLPAYYIQPSWPSWIEPFGRVLATIASVIWLLPKVRLEARIASLAYYGAIAYLSFVPYFPFPWYLPPTTLLAYVAIATVAGQLWQADIKVLRAGLVAGAAVVLAGAFTLTSGAARQARAQQTYIEDGNRRKIGEWLHEHAKPGDTVFMEPLGYIGYFSGLKTYDWPGMSSREMVDASRLVSPGWDKLILFLAPDWVVLRARGEGDMFHLNPLLEALCYERVKDFYRTDDVEKLDVPGKNLLMFDSHFVLYRRKTVMRHDTEGYRIASPIGSSIRTINNARMRMVHAPGYLVMPLAPTATWMNIWFGIPEDAAQPPDATNGAIFTIWLVDGRTRTKLHERKLEPVLRPEDAGLKDISLDLPARKHPLDAWIVLETDPMGNASKDWTFWSTPDIR